MELVEDWKHAFFTRGRPRPRVRTFGNNSNTNSAEEEEESPAPAPFGQSSPGPPRPTQAPSPPRGLRGGERASPLRVDHVEGSHARSNSPTVFEDEHGASVAAGDHAAAFTAAFTADAFSPQKSGPEPPGGAAAAKRSAGGSTTMPSTVVGRCAPHVWPALTFGEKVGDDGGFLGSVSSSDLIEAQPAVVARPGFRPPLGAGGPATTSAAAGGCRGERAAARRRPAKTRSIMSDSLGPFSDVDRTSWSTTSESAGGDNSNSSSSRGRAGRKKKIQLEDIGEYFGKKLMGGIVDGVSSVARAGVELVLDEGGERGGISGGERGRDRRRRKRTDGGLHEA